jgi:hypothetical protein
MFKKYERLCNVLKYIKDGIVCLVTLKIGGGNYLKIRDLLSIALFNILGTHYSIHMISE